MPLPETPSPTPLRFSRLRALLPVVVAERFAAKGIPNLAAALSFYSLLSMAPLLVLMLWLTASLYPNAQIALVEQIGLVAGPAAAQVAETILANADAQANIASLAGALSTGGLIFGATLVFAQLQTSLNLIFRSEHPRFDGIVGWIKQRLFSAGVILGLGFLLVISMLVTTLVQAMFAQVPSVLPIMARLITLLLYAIAFACLYHFVPDHRVRWRQALIGGSITAVLFMCGQYAISLYLTKAAPGSAYGSMGALVISLMWIYYACLVFFAGALTTAVIDEHANARRARRAATRVN